MTARLEYWIEAVVVALEDIGKESLLSQDEIKSMAETLQGGAEQEDMAFGTEFIPNPLEEQMKRLKCAHSTQIDVLKSNEHMLLTNIAKRYGKTAKDIHIEQGEVRWV